MDAIDEGQSIEPRSYDGEGTPCYSDDLLDLRWEGFVDGLADYGRRELSDGIGILLSSDNADLIRNAVEMIGQLAERHIRRLAFPGLLDEDSGREWYRQTRVNELRAHPGYAELAPRAGWPDDPADLNDLQFDQATVHVLMPSLLEEGKWGRYLDDED